MARTRLRSSRKPLSEDNDTIKKEEQNYGSESPKTVNTFMFKGASYESYEEMVKAKRNFNAQMLQKSGLLEASANLRNTVAPPKKAQASQRGLRADRKRKERADPLPRRKSSRIAGVQSDGIYIEDERYGGKVIVGGASIGSSADLIPSSDKVVVETDVERFYNNRVNDGSDLNLHDAVDLCGHKWVKDDSVSNAEEFCRRPLSEIAGDCVSKQTKNSSKSLASQIDELNTNDENCVAKVVPERIYSVAFHPSSQKLIAAAGDKKGFIGLWDVDAASKGDNATDGVYLFKPHSGAVNNLEWNKSGTNLLSLSYDGTIRLFDVNRQSFTEAFAAYDDSEEFKGKLGYGMDEGNRFYTQYACYDHRNEDCMFLSTSVGGVAHLDLRKKGKLTWDMALSEKKVNTVSLHPDGNILATAGLDCEVNLWDIRKFSLKSGSKVQPVATQRSVRSINSAFFSPSGKKLLTTGMADTLDIISDSHLHSGLIKAQKRIRHNNKTGRWLSTFMAQWRPTVTNEELFIVGSMAKPRMMEFFSSEGEMLRGLHGESLTAVVSRCCFHQSSDQLIAVGGNSSGRLTVARK